MTNAQIQQYLPLVNQVARRYRSTEFYEDLKTDAYIKLVYIINNKLKKIDIDKHTDYVWSTLTSTLSLQYLKYTKPAVTFDTHTQVKVNKFCYYKAILEKTIQRKPTIKEMSAALGWSIDEVKQIEIML